MVAQKLNQTGDRPRMGGWLTWSMGKNERAQNLPTLPFENSTVMVQCLFSSGQNFGHQTWKTGTSTTNNFRKLIIKRIKSSNVHMFSCHVWIHVWSPNVFFFFFFTWPPWWEPLASPCGPRPHWAVAPWKTEVTNKSITNSQLKILSQIFKFTYIKSEKGIEIGVKLCIFFADEAFQ